MVGPGDSQGEDEASTSGPARIGMVSSDEASTEEGPASAHPRGGSVEQLPRGVLAAVLLIALKSS